jgi:hypothetical protein
MEPPAAGSEERTKPLNRQEVLVSRLPTRLRGLFITCSLLAVAAGVPLAASANGNTFSGRATVVQATVLGTEIVLADTGPLPSSGGAEEATLVTASVPGLLEAEVLHASTVGQGNASRAEASVAELDLTVAGQSISADVLMARAEARCTPAGASVSGSSEILGLVVNGQAIEVTGAPNQTVVLPLGAGTIIINEQTSSGPGDITVNALHVIVPGVADVVIASAHADITCAGPPPPPPCPGADFVTGGGQITGTPTGSRASFGVAGGIKNGSFWGHLTYTDHGKGGPKVKGTGVTAYSIAGPTTRHIEGTAEVNGVAGFTYAVDVSDNGEPGRSDTFRITLSNGYTAFGTLTGGNIQLHEPCS